MTHYDKIIIGAGLYGLYAAERCGRRGQSVLVLEYDDKPFERATYINQARVHQGYHYPRSLHTALKSAHYFQRFNADYAFCINKSFEQVYATSTEMSWSNAGQFIDFCKAASIPCREIEPTQFFRKGLVDGAFVTEEFTYDARILRDYLIDRIDSLPHVTIQYAARLSHIEPYGESYRIKLADGCTHTTNFLLNATYASVNQILSLAQLDLFNIKYELCEIALCQPNENLRAIGITVMDGPFFSVMPFGKTGLHSLTSVSFTPHQTCREALPIFDCQATPSALCSALQLNNCDLCPSKPQTAFAYMSQLSAKYLQPEYSFTYNRSLYSMKPILQASEIDDSRPTVIKKHTENPTFYSVLSGKINTVYDLDEVLDHD
ncbi:FAD-dependent oxidoreductase [Adlercreutzia sp. R21]|uniref:FAD-dependent oxidoreductase n=1 Tax=Adlercreutzia wanghongyangiae TaxID=3111451 RepID=UPI002DB69A82|nr:FAD-dependent oxidoreductase [Adlercreutzia sp. R21]MEC4185349.1 FAD-dependent oxidoreductase [Adlercreutzia sp. R21]